MHFEIFLIPFSAKCNNQSTFSGQSKNIEFEPPKPLPKYDESLKNSIKAELHKCAWNNKFAKSFELGMYWNFKMGWDGTVS